MSVTQAICVLREHAVRYTSHPYDYEPRSGTAVFVLCAVGQEMTKLREYSTAPLGHDVAGIGGEDLSIQAQLAAEIDVLVARTIYGLGRPEMEYILDPHDVLGAGCDTETFGVLRNRELREFGEYRTRRLILEAWDRLECEGTQ